MEEYESYFETFNFNFTSWSDILENENIDIRSNSCEVAEQNVQLLPRRDVSLYGMIPKMEKRAFSSCKECKRVFNPKDVLLHKNCSLKVKSQHISHFKKKVKSKKKVLPLPPLFPTGPEAATQHEGLNTTPLLPNSIFIVNANELPQISADANLTFAKPTTPVEDVGDIPLPSTPSSPRTHDSFTTPDKTTSKPSDKPAGASSSHVKSSTHLGSKSKKKKYSKSHKETNPKGGTVEDPKGPCTRSIKYSNHCSSENDAFHQNKKTLDIDSAHFSQNNSQEIPVSVPIVYLPMSPVSAITQITHEGDLVCFETPRQILSPTECQHHVYFTIPEQLNVKMYKTRPKLSSLPLYGAQKIGGAIVISKQKLVNQRKDILAAITTKHKPAANLTRF